MGSTLRYTQTITEVFRTAPTSIVEAIARVRSDQGFPMGGGKRAMKFWVDVDVQPDGNQLRNGKNIKDRRV